ncbi:rhodanese-like protein [Leptospira ryugenii]|uniref:Rhodanese-like protein n=1 Tax=Leptospira ryugenii TaxID=1917863 RepID=A0A2P2E3R9_9LEPT|nr:rhodanese-like domain-containing protein [Leptospira ryugenii]GBF51474.1 rhodanese-like protein [Leptospira ryugenii]
MSTKLILIGTIGLVFLFWLVRRQMSQSQNPQIVQDKLKMGAVVLDVRTKAEFETGHFPGAKHIPVDELESRLSELGGKEKAIVVYCASGMRSGRAKSVLESNGYIDVTNAGGLSQMPSNP